MKERYSFGFNPRPKPTGFADPKTWTNPLETQLPYAPEMSVVCLYGTGIPTERGYAYHMHATSDTDEALVRGFVTRQPIKVDQSRSDGYYNGGVHYVDGDGSVPLLSLGFMCSRGWPESHAHNPIAPENFIVKEYPHNPNAQINIRDPHSLLQGGLYSGDHVNILRNHDLLEDLVRMLTQQQQEPQSPSNQSSPQEPQAQWLPEQRIVSRLDEISRNVQWPCDGACCEAHGQAC